MRTCLPGNAAEQPREHVAHLRVAGPEILRHVSDDGVADRALGVQHVGLVQHANRGPAAHGDPAVVRLDPAREHAEQRGLAVAIATDNSDPVTRFDADRDAFKDHARREFEMQAFAAK